MTDINEIGATAFVIACFRAMENDADRPLCNDPYAEWFVNDDIKAKSARLEVALPEIGEIMRYRFCLFDEVVKSGIEDGMRQIVTLGCGFDMRAHIFGAQGVTFYDVDQPAVLSFKKRILEEHGLAPCAAVPCNYLETGLPALLTGAGLDPDQPVLFIWEGNTMYLPDELLFGFLHRLCDELPRFDIAFDYLSRKVIDRTSGIERVTAVTDMFEQLFHVKWLTGFDDLDIFEQGAGLKVSESAGLLEVGKRVAPEAASSMSALAGLYSYAVLRHGS